jgi:fatty-acyl-CoA synthase
LATVTLAQVPNDQRAALADEVHRLLNPFVMRHEVAWD